ncbi:MAG: lipid II:glycine glycyltransferase FemX [Acidobacteriota bacterium]
MSYSRRQFEGHALQPGYRIATAPVNESEWTSLLGRFEDATIYQSWAYAAARWPDRGVNRLILERGGEAVALAQVRVVQLPLLESGMAYVPWGPVWKRKGGNHCLEDLRQIIRALLQEYVLRRRLQLRVHPPDIDVGAEADRIRSVLETEGLRSDSNYSPYRTVLLDLGPSVDQLRKQLSSRWRRQLNVALRNDLQVVDGTSGRFFDEFLHLYKEMLERKRFSPGVDATEFGRIQEQLPDAAKMRIFLSQSEGTWIAGLVISLLGNRGIYLLGATGNAGLKSRASFLLHWRVIEWMKQNGAAYYDLGGIDPNKNPGGYSFKKGVRGNEVSHLGRFEASESRFNRMIISSGDTLRMFVKSSRSALRRIVRSASLS